MQARDFKGDHASRWLSLIESNTKRWNQQDYPQGEYWKYVKFNEIPKADLKWPAQPGTISQISDSHFTTIEIKNFSHPGRIQAESLPAGLSILTHLDELEQGADSPVLSLFEKYDEVNPFAQSALSFTGLGLVIRIAEAIHLEKPLKLIFDLEQMTGKDLHSVFNVLLIGEKRSSSQVFIEIKSESFAGLSNIRVDSFSGEGSETDIYIKEKGSSQSHLVFNLNGKVQKDAILRCFDFSLPSRWSRHNLVFDLDGPGAAVGLKGAYLNNKSYFCDHHTTINHNIKETSSTEDYRGILSGEARAVFNGKVFIAEKACQSNSEQINKNLMLSKKAEIDTKPELQIYNDDVKASHGATVGQLDEEQRFYLQSRGYGAEQARRVLARAFIFDLIESEPDLAKEFYSEDLGRALEQLKEL